MLPYSIQILYSGKVNVKNVKHSEKLAKTILSLVD